MTSATLRGLARFVVLVAIANLATLAQACAADAVLSGTITSSAGKPMAGVTVSVKAQGATITTTVFTDQHGNYYFPPLPAGKYRVWAQALTFATARGEVDLGAAKRQDFALGPLEDFARQLPGDDQLVGVRSGRQIRSRERSVDAVRSAHAWCRAALHLAPRARRSHASGDSVFPHPQGRGYDAAQ
jgi:Carboxypeptidase regulatory-like domain